MLTNCVQEKELGSSCVVCAVAEEDCESRSALVMAPTTDKKKGLLRGLFRLGKLTKKDGKSGCKQAPPSSVKRKPASPVTAATASASQSTERRVTQQEPMYDYLKIHYCIIAGYPSAFYSVAVLGLGQVGHGLPTPATGLPT